MKWERKKYEKERNLFQQRNISMNTVEGKSEELTQSEVCSTLFANGI